MQLNCYYYLYIVDYDNWKTEEYGKQFVIQLNEIAISKLKMSVCWWATTKNWLLCIISFCIGSLATAMQQKGEDNDSIASNYNAAVPEFSIPPEYRQWYSKKYFNLKRKFVDVEHYTGEIFYF